MKTSIKSPLRNYFFAIAILVCTSVSAQEPVSTESVGLSTAIDEIVKSDFDLLTAPQEMHGLLLRRLSLDLRNVVPTQSELDAFLSETDSGRWQRWVNRFLDDPLANERIVDWLDKTLMQRRPFQHVDRAAWIAMLRKSVDERTPLDKLVRDILGSEWWHRDHRAQQRFYLDRGGDPHAIGRDLGRILFGRDMQCAQCHDHPQIDDYLQLDYHGILSFVSPSALAEAKFMDDKGAEQKLQMYVERASGDAPFESVFDKGVLFRTGARLPDTVEFAEPYLPPDARYAIDKLPSALDGIPNAPLVSRRAVLVSKLNSSSQAFAENWANRLWAMMFGRGLVHPLDMHHPDNPPTHPELLRAISQALIVSNFDTRTVIEQIALSRIYQRGRALPIETHLRNGAVIEMEPSQFDALRESVTTRIQVANDLEKSNNQAANDTEKAMTDARAVWKDAQKERVAVRSELDSAEASFNDSKKKFDAATDVKAKSQKQRDDLGKTVSLLDQSAIQLQQAKDLIPGEDAELQQAILVAKARADTSRNQLPNLDKAFADATTAADVAKSSLEVERTKIMAIVDKLQPVEKNFQQADQSFVLARAAWRRAREAEIAASRQTGELLRLAEWIKDSTAVRAANIENEQQRESIRVSSQLLTQQTEQLTVTKNTIENLQSRIASMASGRSELGVRLTEIENEIRQLRVAIDSLDATNKLLPNADRNAAAVSDLRTAISIRESSAAEVSSQLASQDTQQLSIESEIAASRAIQEQHIAAVGATQNRIDTESVAMKSKEADLAKLVESCTVSMNAVLHDRERLNAMAGVRALSPEQLGWSILRSTGVFDSYLANERAELDKAGALPTDAGREQKIARELLVTRGAIDKLRGNIDVFSNLYASGVGQTSDEFFASPDQALYMSNGDAVFRWSVQSGNNVTGAVANQVDNIQAAQQLFWSLLSRSPTVDEQSWLVEKLSVAPEMRPTIAQELVWSVLTSSEYRVYP